MTILCLHTSLPTATLCKGFLGCLMSSWPTVHRRGQGSPPLDSVLDHFSTVHAHNISSNLNLICTPTKSRRPSLSSFFSSNESTHFHYLFHPCTLHIPPTSSFRIIHTNNMRCREQFSGPSFYISVCYPGKLRICY
jgi:hypothetical protein